MLVITIHILVMKKITSNQLGYICSSSFFEENRTLEIINCVSEDFNLTYECRIKSDQKINNRIYDSILSNLIIYPIKNDLNYVFSTFKWRKILHKKIDHPIFYNQEKNITMTKESNRYLAKLVLYKISHENEYEICTKVPNISIQNLCCRMEKHETEEESIYMSLIVIGIVFIINFAIVIVFWKCPPSAFQSLDEMLKKLPTSHVKKLKKLILENQDSEDIDISSEKMDQKKNFNDKKILYKNRRRNNFKNITFSDDQANKKEYPSYEEDLETDKIDDIEQNLRFEIKKIRRLSKVSLDSIKFDKNDSSKSNKKNFGVKFADHNNEIILDMNYEVPNFRKKIIDENKRRASINPFKKTFKLDISSESSDYSD
jgi:hypothetical protein